MRPDAPGLTRRIALAGGLLAGLQLGCAQAEPFSAASFEAIEARLGGPIGLDAWNTADGGRVSWRADQRFWMCSTFKPLAVAALLDRVDHGHEKLNRFVRYGRADLLSYAPVTTANLGRGGMSLNDLCAAAIEVSDNTAANLILKTLGGPDAVTRYARDLGDPLTRLDRTEPTLNDAKVGDLRDTTTPAAMVGLWRQLLVRDTLSQGSRQRLFGWLRACQTGPDRLPAAAPKDWTIGHKTGSGDNGAAGDVALLMPPGKSPILIAAYLGVNTAPPEAHASAIAEAGRLALRRLTVHFEV